MFLLFAALLQSEDSMKAVTDALTEAFASGDVVLAVVAAVLLAVVVVLKFLGKKVPFVDVGISIVLGVVRKMFAGKVVAPGVKAVVEPVKDGEAPKTGGEGLGSVVNIKKDE
jgi:hypothetical protein